MMRTCCFRTALHSVRRFWRREGPWKLLVVYQTCRGFSGSEHMIGCHRTMSAIGQSFRYVNSSQLGSAGKTMLETEV